MNETSTQKLLIAHKDLQRLFCEVDRYCPCVITCSIRGQAEQDIAFNSGTSKVRWPNSKHNVTPSLAVDVVPFPVDWKNWKKFYYFAGVVMTIAEQLNIKIRWGGDFDRDYDFSNDRFIDLPHWEIDT